MQKKNVCVVLLWKPPMDQQGEMKDGQTLLVLEVFSEDRFDLP